MTTHAEIVGGSQGLGARLGLKPPAGILASLPLHCEAQAHEVITLRLNFLHCKTKIIRAHAP